MYIYAGYNYNTEFQFQTAELLFVSFGNMNSKVIFFSYTAGITASSVRYSIHRKYYVGVCFLVDVRCHEHGYYLCKYDLQQAVCDVDCAALMLPLF